MTIRIQPGASPPVRRPLLPRPIPKAWFRPARPQTLAAATIFILLLGLWWYAGQWYEERLLVEQKAEVIGELSARGSVLTSVLSRRLVEADPGFRDAATRLDKLRKIRDSG